MPTHHRRRRTQGGDRRTDGGRRGLPGGGLRPRAARRRPRAFGAERLEAIATPGHTPGSTCFLWRQPEASCVFTGDTLLIGGCGRTDFQGGDAGFLWDSVTRRLFTLPDDTIVLPGHDYHGRSHSRIGIERRSNPRFAGHTRESFVAQMAAQLPPPRLIDAAVPANKRAGADVPLRQAVQGV
jgi:sulfur dioxygenase